MRGKRPVHVLRIAGRLAKATIEVRHELRRIAYGRAIVAIPRSRSSLTSRSWRGQIHSDQRRPPKLLSQTQSSSSE